MIRVLVAVLALVCAVPAFAQPAAKADPENTIVLDTTKGKIVIRLRPDLAPKHAERIKLLTREKFYDNVPFHRVIANFMAQTGDPTGTGSGGSKYPDLPAEFSSVPYERGIVGMARTDDPNSANSQFFIMYATVPSLNNKYTVVGQVISGMNVVDKLKKGPEANNGMVTSPDRILHAQVQADIDAEKAAKKKK